MGKPTVPAAPKAAATAAHVPPAPVVQTPAELAAGEAAATTALGTFDLGVALPAMTRVFGAPGMGSEYADLLRTFPAPAADGTLASKFFAGTPAPATVTDPKEQEKALKESVRKLANSVTGAARRVVNSDPTYNFTTRTVTENGKLGIRVFRIAPEAPAPVAAAPAPAVPPAPVAVAPAPVAAPGAPLPPPPAS